MGACLARDPRECKGAHVPIVGCDGGVDGARAVQTRRHRRLWQRLRRRRPWTHRCVYYKTGDIGSKSLYAFHDMHSEWAWLRELARNGVIEWLGCQFNSSDSGSQPDLKYGVPYSIGCFRASVFSAYDTWFLGFPSWGDTY